MNNVEIIADLRETLGDVAKAADIFKLVQKKYGLDARTFILTDERMVRRGYYSLMPRADDKVQSVPPVSARAPKASKAAPAASSLASLIHKGAVQPLDGGDDMIPAIDPTYVKFGDADDIQQIIESKIFYPAYITGLSGNGKSMSVEQACALLKRKYIRVNITNETDEDALIGGHTLVEGNMTFREGPVITAMRHGAILLLDEVDLNSVNILCLQPILEGKPYFNKKTGEIIHPAAGFNIFATANTKGRGSANGRFVGTKMMNEAFMERFPVTFEQAYPPPAVEKRILQRNMNVLGLEGPDNEEFAQHLTTWAEVIRKSFEDGASEDLISTRRLVSIIRALAIFGSRKKAIQRCLSRFEADTAAAFFNLYTKIDPKVK